MDERYDGDKRYSAALVHAASLYALDVLNELSARKPDITLDVVIAAFREEAIKAFAEMIRQDALYDS